jgi:hypothetical protein
MATFKRTGTLHGTNTLDTIVFTVDLPAEITYTLKATGEGNNKLRAVRSPELRPDHQGHRLGADVVRQLISSKVSHRHR